jgi:hypothetical protein
VSQDSDCKFLYEHTEATATCMLYINRCDTLGVKYSKPLGKMLCMV